jgi:hypothetical protein
VLALQQELHPMVVQVLLDLMVLVVVAIYFFLKKKKIG